MTICRSDRSGRASKASSTRVAGGVGMFRLMFWRALALATGGLLQMRVLVITLLAAYLIGWILGSVYARVF